MVNETALEIYTDSASIVGATLQESLLVALKDNNVQAGLAAKFPDVKFGLIGVSGDLIKVNIAYQSGDPDAIGKELFSLLGGVIGGWVGGTVGRVGGGRLWASYEFYCCCWDWICVQ